MQRTALFIKVMSVHLGMTLCISLFAYSESKRAVEPLVLQAPFTDREEGLKFGQSACISWSGRYVAIGANGFQHYRGAIYVHELVAKNGRRTERWEQKRVVADDTESAEERTQELRPQNRGSGFGFSCAFASLAGADYDNEEDDDDNDIEDGKTGQNEMDNIPDAIPRLVVGAPGKDMQRGAVYIFARTTDGEWRKIDKLISYDRRGGDTFGWDVTVDARCTTIIVGARGRRANNGEVIIFQCAVGCKSCAISDHIHPPDFSDSLGPHGIRIRNNFGMSVASSADGNTLAIGCTGFEEERGAVYIYSRIRQIEGSNNDGDHIENDNNTKLNNECNDSANDGANEDNDGNNTDDNNGSENIRNSGNKKAENDKNANCIKERFVWNLTQRLESPKAQKHGFFGFKVDMDAHGNTIVVGADGEDEYRGAAFIYERMIQTNEKNSNESAGYKLSAEIRSKGRENEDNFGGSVSIAANGEVIAIGAPGARHGHLNDHGVVHFYERKTRRWKPSTWEHSDSMWLPTSHSRQHMLFAWAVSISGDGRTLVATGPDWGKSLGLAAVRKFKAKGKPTWDWYQDVTTALDRNSDEKEEL